MTMPNAKKRDIEHQVLKMSGTAVNYNPIKKAAVGRLHLGCTKGPKIGKKFIKNHPLFCTLALVAVRLLVFREAIAGLESIIGPKSAIS